MRLRRVGRFGFPTDELISDGRVVAELGRDGSLRIFFGRGRRVRLDDGTEWRIKATTSGPFIVPIIRTPTGTVIVSAPLRGKRSYGITGQRFGYVLVPLGRVRMRGRWSWGLRRQETDVAIVDEDLVLHALEPIPLAAVLIVFTLISHGIPGETALRPSAD